MNNYDNVFVTLILFVISMCVISGIRKNYDTGIPNKPDYSLVNVDGLIVHDNKGNTYKLEQVKGHYHYVHKLKVDKPIKK